MSQPIKISETDLAEIKLLQSKFQESIFKLGNLQVEKIELDKRVEDFLSREKQLKEEWNGLQKLEQGVIDKILQTYGEVNLNITDGTVTPISPPSQKT